MKPTTCTSASQTGEGEGSLALRSGRSITRPQLHREEHVWGASWAFDPMTGEPLPSNVGGTARLAAVQARLAGAQAEIEALRARELVHRQTARRAHDLLLSDDSDEHQGREGGGRGAAQQDRK